LTTCLRATHGQASNTAIGTLISERQFRPKMGFARGSENQREESVMMTLRQFSAEPSTIPNIASWYLADLSKTQGKQELFTHQSSQKLKILREHALIESAISSNRIEDMWGTFMNCGLLIIEV
jgi:hypothetical protein